MKLRVVTLFLIVAVGIGSPAIASSPADEQQVNGRGARDRGSNRDGGSSNGGGENRGAERRRGDTDGAPSGAARTATRRDNGEQRAATRPADRDAEPERYAVPRSRDGNRDSYRDGTRVVVNRRPANVNVFYGSAYRGPRYYTPVQYDRWARHYLRWSPVGYAPWSLIYGSIGFSNFSVAYGSPYYAYAGYGPYAYPYGYGYGPGPYSPWQVSGSDVGGVRLKMKPRDAQVFVDGYYAGIVDDFDGTFQSLRLESGGHKIEVHMPGFQDLELDVHVQPGRTITVGEDLRARP